MISAISHRNTAFMIVYSLSLLAFMVFSFGRFVFQSDVLDASVSFRVSSDEKAEPWSHRQLMEEVDVAQQEQQQQQQEQQQQQMELEQPKATEGSWVEHNVIVNHPQDDHPEESKPSPQSNPILEIETFQLGNENGEGDEGRRGDEEGETGRRGEVEQDGSAMENQDTQTIGIVELSDMRNVNFPEVTINGDMVYKAETCDTLHLTIVGDDCAIFPDYLKTSLPDDMQRLPIYPKKIRYLGVLLDAGRHWYPVKWIKNLIDILHLMNYNLLHFRLTDDQAFNVRFDSHPKLATAAWNAPDNNRVYTTDELRYLVNYAKKRNITIMPEINMPGHAGGWAGEIPYVVVPCANFICSKGYGIPLNMSHLGLYDMLRDIVNETRSIFHTSPYLHLGGDELHMSSECFGELGKPMDNYTIFEDKLRDVVLDLGIDEKYIVRWETSGHPPTNRVGKVVHWWESLRFHDTTHNWIEPNVFVSKGLYFDTNQMEDAFFIFGQTVKIARHHKTPIGVVAGTFELGPDDWNDRNILGRLLSVAMGASELEFGFDDKLSFDAKYMELCTFLKLPARQCMLYGVPPVTWDYWRNFLWNSFTSQWRLNLCTRLTDTSIVRVHKNTAAQVARYNVMPGVVNNFWEHFGEEIATKVNPLKLPPIDIPLAIKRIRGHDNVSYTGIVLDITRGHGTTNTSSLIILKSIIDFMFLLGFNMLQLRIMNEMAFAVAFDAHPELATIPVDDRYNTTTLKEINEYAKQRGIMIMPEISLSTRAGGWVQAGYNTPCPMTMCDESLKEFPSLSVNVNDATFLSVVSSVLYELKEVFGTGYLHLGYNDRADSMPCFEEANIRPAFDLFETKVELLLEFHGYDSHKVVRWEERSKGDRGTRRAGKITHFKETTGVSGEGESHFSSAGLAFDYPQKQMRDGYAVYQQVRKLVGSSPSAVLALAGPFHRWNLLAIKERLLAVAIGCSLKDLSLDQFNTTFQSICGALPDLECVNMGKIKKFKTVKNEMVAEMRELRMETCDTHSFPMEVAIPKPGVLISL